MGTVYVGEDETLQRKVAVKAIHGEHRLHEQAKARFLREARILSQVNHHNICVVHDFIETEDSDFLVLELVPGRSLRAAMKTQLPDRQKLDIARQLLEVLVSVHSAGVIHRDLKPENIMVKPDGKITVLDFGLARSVDEDVAMFPGTPTLDLEDLESQAAGEAQQGSGSPPSIHVKSNQGTVIGTAGYMSPEQALAEPATAASDIYSVGLILQELFTGSSPFEPGLSPMGKVIKTAGGETLPVTGLPTDLTVLIERLEAFAPGARPSAVDALDQLQQIIDKPKRRRKQAVITVVWIALAGLAGGMTIQSVRASREAERANLEATAAQKVSDFLEAMCLEALAIREKVLSPEHPSLGVSFQNLARVYRNLGRNVEAEEMYRRSLAIYKEAYNPGHPQRVGVATSLSDFLRELGRDDEAAELEAQETDPRATQDEMGG